MRALNNRRDNVVVSRQHGGTVTNYYQFQGMSELVAAVKIWQIFDKLAAVGESTISVTALRVSLDQLQ